jgi:hypothetical protein
MWYVDKKFKVILGGITFIDTPNLVTYKNIPLFKIERRESDGLLGISFDIYDHKGTRIATIRENRIVQGYEENYIFIREANRYAVIEKKTGDVICNILKRADAAPAELNVSVRLFTPDGFLFDATPERTNIAGATIRNVTIEKARIGIKIT